AGPAAGGARRRPGAARAAGRLRRALVARHQPQRRDLDPRHTARREAPACTAGGGGRRVRSGRPRRLEAVRLGRSVEGPEVVRTKRSVAVLIRHPDDATQVLLVQRPDDDEDLPGVWGLPAATLRDGETRDD